MEKDMFTINKNGFSYPASRKELWGEHLWNPSYCAVTVSDRSREQVFAYIEGQKEKSR
jgi:putative transposase